jgi:integrase
MQALSLAVHLPLVCFGIAFPWMVLFCGWRSLRTARRCTRLWEFDETGFMGRREASINDLRYDYAPLIRTALYTGLRQGELLGLQWRDLDLDEGVLYVRRQWTRSSEYGPTKTRAGLRRIPLPRELVQFFIELKLRGVLRG